MGGGFEVDEEVEGLATVGVVDAISGVGWGEWCGWVLAVEGI